MESIVLERERQLSVGTAEARTIVMRCLRAQDFKVTSEQVSMVTAKRGSQVLGSVQPNKLPITATARFVPLDGGCTVTIRLADGWRTGAEKVWGLTGPFRSVMEEIRSRLDLALDPLATSSDTVVPTRSSEPGEVSSLARANAIASKVGAEVGARAEELLGSRSSVNTTPRALEEVALRGPSGVAYFDRMAAQSLLTVALLVSSQQGSMPPNLAADVETLAARIEAAVVAQSRGRVLVDLTEAEVPVAEFLARQALLRDRLPLRTLHVCTTCKLERVVNPDFAKLQERAQRKHVLSGMVGASISSHGVRPFFLVGTLLKLKNFDTPFVCQRCQGLDADSSLVTYCPQCGERRSEAVLRKCARCDYRFSALLGESTATLWVEELPAPGPPSLPAGSAPVSVQPAGPDPRGDPRGEAVAQPTTGTAASGGPAPGSDVPATPSGVRTPAAPPPGWYPDQTRRHRIRYWDGSTWTGHVRD